VTRTILVAGAGGVGKTTIAAAVAAAAARGGVATLVLTVDPARRLGTALGLGHLGADPTPVPGAADLWAAMLDASAAWEAIVRRHAEPESVDRLLASPYFQAISRRFPAGQAYAAAEQLADYVESADWELVVVDTPPVGGGIEFFSSPQQIRRLVGGRALRWLTGARLPGRRRLYSVTARPVLRIADTVLGSELLEDVAEFLLDLRTAYDGVTRRSRRVEGYLRSADCVLVASAEPGPLGAALRFYRDRPGGVSPPRCVVFNRALPVDWAAPDAAGPGVPPLLRSAFEPWHAEAVRQADAYAELAGRADTDPIRVPWTTPAPTSLPELAELVDRSDERLADLVLDR
jgi:anion-transporting  ArsA/GET3 family ATPase